MLHYKLELRLRSFGSLRRIQIKCISRLKFHVWFFSADNSRRRDGDALAASDDETTVLVSPAGAAAHRNCLGNGKVRTPYYLAGQAYVAQHIYEGILRRNRF